ncbi:hypothetical protein HPB48_001196 [Haemaphysalis longicornis]|uniref:Uncharacterized protein n=1 Tax=Haemaphysalis longicornis TaxID=44386 RepID=A0A9J6FID5_HAELO|nr:hypothetical protein HPB48_001196 [Haemaphysalis longicornis]
MLCELTTEARGVLVLVVVLVSGFCSSYARNRHIVNTTCPQLVRCQCSVRRQGSTALCRNVSQFQELGPDMAMLQNVTVKRLTFDHVLISEIPGDWFSNHTVHMLVVRNCPLRDIGETAFTRMGRLFRLIIENAQLESVPSGLSAASHLKALRIHRSKFLKGVMKLPVLDLRSNAIKTVDEKFLSASPKLKYLVLSGNHIQHIPNRLFKNTRKLKIVEFRDNRITAVSSLFGGLDYLQVSYLSSKMPKVSYVDD